MQLPCKNWQSRHFRCAQLLSCAVVSICALERSPVNDVVRQGDAVSRSGLGTYSGINLATKMAATKASNPP